MLHYMVRATCPSGDTALRDRWIAWLLGGHAADVVAAGALSAEVVRLDGAPPAAEARYVFADAAAFARYEAEHAPRLRAEGLAHFPPACGLVLARATGQVLGRWPGTPPPGR